MVGVTHMIPYGYRNKFRKMGGDGTNKAARASFEGPL